MRSISVLSRCTDSTTRWATSLTKQPDWVVAVANDLTLKQARRVQAVAETLLAEAGAR